MSRDTASIRGQLGNDPETFPVLNADYSETIVLQEQSTIISTNGIGNSFILGHATNGILGTATAVGGSQIVLGEDGRVETRIRVVNPNKRYREHFGFDDFKGTATTADWDTANQKLSLTSGEVAKSKAFALGDGNIAKATLTYDLDSGSEGDLTLKLASDGTNLEVVTKDNEHTFSNVGDEGIWEITSAGTAVVKNLRINYG